MGPLNNTAHVTSEPAVRQRYYYSRWRPLLGSARSRRTLIPELDQSCWRSCPLPHGETSSSTRHWSSHRPRALSSTKSTRQTR
ncbi:hypothetical protein TB2_003254 [Malus domestica]